MSATTFLIDGRASLARGVPLPGRNRQTRAPLLRSAPVRGAR